MPRSTAIRAAACTVLAAGLAAPLLRRRLRLKPPVVIAAAAATPFALGRRPALARARRGDVRAADVRLPRDVPDAQRRSGEAARARVRVEYPVTADRLIGVGHDADAAAAAGVRHARALPRLGEAARVVALGVVRVPARDRRLRADQPPRPVPARPRRGSTRRSTSASSATGRSRRPRRGSRPQQGLMEDGRTPELRRMMVEYGEQFWKQGWAPLYGVLGRQPPGRHAVAALRHVRDGRARPERHGPGRGRARLDLRRHARPRARLPRRALRRRPGRRAGAGGDDPRPRRPRSRPPRAGSRRALQRSRRRRGYDPRAGADASTSPPPGDDATTTTIAVSSSTAARS